MRADGRRRRSLEWYEDPFITYLLIFILPLSVMLFGSLIAGYFRFDMEYIGLEVVVFVFILVVLEYTKQKNK